jgi:two-component system, sensor histidine kinase
VEPFDVDERDALLRLADDAFIAAPFLADLCHQVRTPLNGILGTLELLLEGDLPEESRELATAAYESAIVLHRVFEADLDAAHDSVAG